MIKKTYLQSADALGSNVELRLSTSDPNLANSWFVKLWDEISEFEKDFSRFKNDSKLSRFNNKAGERVPISKTFELILKRAKDFSQTTEGLFNPFVLPALQKSGYVHSMTSLVFGPDYSGRELVDWKLLEIGDGWAQVPPDTALDLGGIGKGFLADKLADLLENNLPDYCLSLGGDIRVGGLDGADSWKIDIESPQKDSEPQFFYTNTKQIWGIATSGATREKSRRKQQHLIDPATGTSVTSPAICTVVAKDATAADVLASCILIAGEDLAVQLHTKAIIDGVLLQEENGRAFLLGAGFFQNHE